MGKRQRISNIVGGNGSNDVGKGTAKLKRTRKSGPRDSPSQRSSIYRGVTRHRWTGRYEAHLWDKNCWNESQHKKGKQVYLGAYDAEETAAHAYDLAALKYWGHETILNFPISAYEEELKEMESQSREEYIGSLRRKSSGFSRGVSKYRGVARHHHNGRWEARIGRVFGNKYLYLGTYEEAATAYDIAAIEYRGLNAVTNFDLSRYVKWLRPPNSEGATDDADPITAGILQTSPHDLLRAPDPNEPTGSRGGVATASALGLLLQSSKFKEMLQKASAESTTTSSSSSSSPMTPNSCEDNKSLIQCNNFPDYIQTYFDSLNGGSFIEEEDDFSIFGEFSNFVSSPILIEEDIIQL
ncbi:AP2-like ethylene-responsive transcription factor At1g16060 isoform X2 [Zingiber officinale]|uniref:AP2-like ethylene-responsive transcription factor At1g16060 isoform X2 n=1 Tax=Zingiber officinale TaxID=94328 RepID=UPI001C4B041F|nr:AP2-like ethylene-responsive transcription factor At1g16060 isoform X2 [Zingiber officinale]